MPISVRIAHEDDVPALAALRHAWNEENAGSAIVDRDFNASFTAWWEAERTSRTFFIVESDGDVVGMASVKRYDRMPAAGHRWGECWGYVGNVFVRADHRNAGAGRALMDEVIAWAGRTRMRHLRLAPSPRSEPFYARLGFNPGAVFELDPPTT